MGGMAAIYLAKARGIGGFEKLIALKMIHEHYSADEHFVQMLIDEAKISVQLQHVNIGQIFDLGRIGDTYYITMEYIDGADLFKILRRASELDRDMPIEVAAFIAQEVCAGLDYAHNKKDEEGRPLGVIHRDISPQNVMVSYAGEVKVVDFGIAKAALRARQTAAGVIKGKYYYMSPEQAWGDPVDARTDIFSTGILLYEMLTGQMLYLEDDLHRLLDRVRRADIPLPTTRRPDIPRELEQVVMRALKKRPEDRFQSAHEFQLALQKFLFSYAPDFSPQRLAAFVKDVLGEKAEPSLEATQPRGVVSIEDLAPDEHSVIFRLQDLAKAARKAVPVRAAPRPGPFEESAVTELKNRPLQPAENDDITSPVVPIPERPQKGAGTTAPLRSRRPTGGADDFGEDSDPTLIDAGARLFALRGEQSTTDGGESPTERRVRLPGVDDAPTSNEERAGEATVALRPPKDPLAQRSGEGVGPDTGKAQGSRGREPLPLPRKVPRPPVLPLQGVTAGWRRPASTDDDTGEIEVTVRTPNPMAPIESSGLSQRRLEDDTAPTVIAPHPAPDTPPSRGQPPPPSQVQGQRGTAAGEGQPRGGAGVPTAGPLRGVPGPGGASGGSVPAASQGGARGGVPSRQGVLSSGGVRAVPAAPRQVLPAGACSEGAGSQGGVSGAGASAGRGEPPPVLPAETVPPTGAPDKSRVPLFVDLDATPEKPTSAPGASDAGQMVRGAFEALRRVGPEEPPGGIEAMNTPSITDALPLPPPSGPFGLSTPEEWNLSSESTSGALLRRDAGSRRWVGWAVAVGVVVGIATIAVVVASLERESPVGSIEVASVPSGAEVKIDDAPAGRATPVVISGVDRKLAHKVVVSLSGYESWERQVAFEPKQQALQVIAVLTPIVGVIAVETEPPGALLLLDGRPQGTTPRRVEGLSVGKPVHLSVQLPGYKSLEKTVDWSQGRTVELKLQLVPEGAAKGKKGR